MAELHGLYERETTTALLVGSYVDAYFSGEMEDFIIEHPEIFTKQGELKSEYRQANYIIERICRDEMFMRYIGGEQQVIKTGEIEGVPFKIKMDSYHPEKAIVDLKIMRDFASIYKEGQGRLNFIEAWQYDIQGAVYQAIEGNSLPFYIAASTKEKEPDLAIIEIDQPTLNVALDIVKHKAPYFQKIKMGEIEPRRCEKCDWCKRTKKLTEILTLEDFNEQHNY